MEIRYCFPAVKKLLAFCALSMPLHSMGQSSPVDILRQKTEHRLQEIIAASPAVTGLTAIDLTDGERFSINGDIVFPQASAIKIPILMEVFRQAGQGKFSLDDVRKIAPENVVGGTGIITTLARPVSLSIRNLCILMITQSDNTATNTLIDLVGMRDINATLKSLGLEQTLVQRKMINPAASARGEENISTPSEAAAILKLLSEGKFVSKEVSEGIIEILKKNPREHSRLAAGIPASVPLAFKPGGISGVSTEWALVLLEERTYAIAVMESYKIAGQAESVAEQLSGVIYNYFWRKGNATRYGTYADPELLKDQKPLR